MGNFGVESSIFCMGVSHGMFVISGENFILRFHREVLSELEVFAKKEVSECCRDFAHEDRIYNSLLLELN